MTRDEITVEMAPGRDISVKEFATLFPITTDASVLPAATGGNSNGNAQASGAYFSPFSVDPLDPVLLNKLAPQEELGNFVLEIPTGGNVIPDQAGRQPPPGRATAVSRCADLRRSCARRLGGHWWWTRASSRWLDRKRWSSILRTQTAIHRNFAVHSQSMRRLA